MPDSVYDFRSDNVGGAAPELLEALIAASDGTAAPYGDDDFTRRMVQRFSDIFERPVQVFRSPPAPAPTPSPWPPCQRLRRNLLP